MIIDVASEKLAICHWVIDGQRSEGVFRVRSLVSYKTGQQSLLWPETTSLGSRVVFGVCVRAAAHSQLHNQISAHSGGVFVQLELLHH